MIENKDKKAWKWLNENELSYHIWNNKYRYDDESFDEWLDRVSGKNPKIKELIYEKKFIFGGRTLANRGTKRGSYSNCYSIGYVPDSLDEIMDVNTKIALTFKSQGGQGLSLSKLRPKGALIANKYPSDGIVPFMEIFNTTTDSISQGGSRKGALMMSLDINHPEAETFMTIKSDLKKINKANLSMEIDDTFMRSLSSDKEEENKRKFKLLAEHACKYAEPGVLFTNRLRNYNLMEYVDDYQIETTNPCGEQPLPKHGACNLSSINISEYINNPFQSNCGFDIRSFVDDVTEIVKAMDDVLEENAENHALQEQRDCAKKWRNIGIGVMGIQDAMIKLGMVYGSETSLGFVRLVMSTLLRTAVFASSALGKERGNFPGYSKKVWSSSILKKVFSDEEIAELKEKNTLRNCALLSVAPTGSIGTMWNVSTGVEPWFNTHFTRNTKSLDGKETSYKVWAPVIQEAMKYNWHPETYVGANDIPWKSHIDIQAVCQEYVDASISKTCNLPKDTTPEEIEDLYFYAWAKGLKGCTIYVEGSRDPILSNSTTEEQKSLESPENGLKMDSILPTSRTSLGDCLQGTTFKKNTACGTLYITINKDQDGNIVEIFTNSSKNGTCKANLNGETRLASLALRAGVKVDEVVDTLKSIQCQSCAFARAKGNTIDGTSCPDIISKCIAKAYATKPVMVEDSPVKDKENTCVCPECGKPLRHEGGCLTCECGYSKCG